MKGSSMQNLVMFRELCGTETLKNILFVTTKWDVANKDPTQQEMAAARQEQLQTKFLRNELSLGARLVKHDGTVQSANEILRELLGRPAVLLDIQKELCVDKIALKETSAGKTLNAKLEKEQQRLEAQYAAGLKAASDERSEMVRTMLQESSARFKEQLERVNAQKKSLEEGEVLRAGRIEELERKLETASKGQGQDSNNFLTNLVRFFPFFSLFFADSCVSLLILVVSCRASYRLPSMLTTPTRMLRRISSSSSQRCLPRWKWTRTRTRSWNCTDEEGPTG